MNVVLTISVSSCYSSLFGKYVFKHWRPHVYMYFSYIKWFKNVIPKKTNQKKVWELDCKSEKKSHRVSKKKLPLNVCHILCIYLPDFEVAKNSIIHQFTGYRTQVMTTLLTLYHFSLFHQVEPASEHWYWGQINACNWLEIYLGYAWWLLINQLPNTN